MGQEYPRAAANDWVSFPGGELEGKRPRTLCPACRDSLARAAAGASQASGPRSRTLCFQCYRAELDRQRALGAAGALHTASDERFQFQLPFEPINRPRLVMLKAERALARVVPAGAPGGGGYLDKRRRAQIAARRALQAIAAGVGGRERAAADRDRVWAAAIHAAELQLPEAWLPFVVAR